MKRRMLCGVLAAAWLAGCSFGAGPAKVTKTSYTLQPAATGTRMPAQAPARTAATLRIDTIDAPVWLNTTDLYYQLDYSDTQRLSAYSDSQWVAAPPQILEHLLQDGVVAGNMWKAVIGPESGTPADYALRVDLSDFKQSFAAPRRSYGVLHARATLSRENPQSIVAQRTFDYRVPAPSPNARGGVDALSQAGQRFVTDVNQWLAQVMPP